MSRLCEEEVSGQQAPPLSLLQALPHWLEGGEEGGGGLGGGGGRVLRGVS